MSALPIRKISSELPRRCDPRHDPDEASDASGEREAADRRAGDAAEREVPAHQVLQQRSSESDCAMIAHVATQRYFVKRRFVNCQLVNSQFVKSMKETSIGQVINRNRQPSCCLHHIGVRSKEGS